MTIPREYECGHVWEGESYRTHRWEGPRCFRCGVERWRFTRDPTPAEYFQIYAETVFEYQTTPEMTPDRIASLLNWTSGGGQQQIGAWASWRRGVWV